MGIKQDNHNGAAHAPPTGTAPHCDENPAHESGTINTNLLGGHDGGGTFKIKNRD
jgi:hypothetical protein